jgi:hypothetical protein
VARTAWAAFAPATISLICSSQIVSVCANTNLLTNTKAMLKKTGEEYSNDVDVMVELPSRGGGQGKQGETQ